MGLSSSQARLLHLTSRMHQIEYKAAKLEAEKLQMANESSRVYEDYLLALDKTKVQGKILTTDGSITYVDMTYQSMLDRGYQLKFQGDDRVVISRATETNFNTANGDKNYFIALETGRITPTNNQAADGFVEIYTAEQLMNITSGQNVRLMTNIDMTGKTWSPKSLSSGKTFDGNGYTISGLTNTLFSSVYGNIKNLNVNGNIANGKAIVANYVYSNATIDNVSVSGSLNSTSENVGALASYVSGSNVKITNCSSNASVTTTNRVCGNLIGYMNRGSIDNCTSFGSTQGDSNVGGLIGIAENATITNSSANASVYATHADLSNSHGADECSGGFVGTVNNSTITNCEAKGEVKGNGGVIGGFVGLGYGNSTITNCNAYGNVTSNILGLFTDKPTNTAGFISASHGMIIKNCNAYGTISSGGDEANCAGFVNSNMSGSHQTFTDIIENCYSSSNRPFATVPGSIDTLTETTTPNFNVVSASGASTSVVVQVEDTGNYGSLFDAIKTHGYILEGATDNPAAGHENDTTWFTNMILEGLLYIFKPDATQEDGYIQVSVATDTNLQEVSDEILLKKAEAQYEADMKKIDRKDRQYDTELARLENERNAISQEMDTLKTVAKENVDRTFKLFS